MLFGLLPPEVNSGRMYSGPGSGPLRAAAAAWDQLADHLYTAASAYSAEVSALSSGWRGPSSAAMVAASQPYAAWMVATAGQADRTAAQAASAAAAFEDAFAATVPPPVIAANRTQLAVLIATNFMGQNTPLIAETEALYAEMWAQDAAAMYGYAASASAASVLTPFGAPPRTTDANGAASQGLALAHAAADASGAQAQSLPQALSAMSQSMSGVTAANAQAGAGAPSLLSAFDDYFTGRLSPFLLLEIGAIPELLAAQLYLLPQALADAAEAPGAAAATASLDAPAGSASVTVINTAWGELARADMVGGLAVPHAWTVAAPTVKTAAVASAASDPPGPADSAAVSAEDPDALINEALPAALPAQGRFGLSAEVGASNLAGRSVLKSRGNAGSVGWGSACAADAPENVSNIFVISERGE